MYGGFCLYVSGIGGYRTSIKLVACNDPTPHAVSLYNSREKLQPLVASLKTCRQIYHEARNVFYSANTFEISTVKEIGGFLRCLDTFSNRSLAIRRLHITMSVFNKIDERYWDNGLHALAEGLKNLRHVHIRVRERIWSVSYPRRQSPAVGKAPFLQGLLELKKLSLKTIEIIVELYEIRSVRDNRYIWTGAQKQAWAQSMESGILGTD